MNDDLATLNSPIVQALLDLLPGTLHVKDRDMRYRIVNRNYLERWGAAREDVLGRTSSEAFGDLFGDAPDDRNRQVLETGLALPFYEVSYPTEDGGGYILWATKVPLLDEDGKATHVMTFSLDITPLKETQRLLSESEAVHSAVVEHALDCLITIDESGTIVEFNPAAEQVFGISRTTALGREIGEVVVPPALQEAHREGLARSVPGSLRDRGGRRFETIAMRADGTLFPIEISVAEIPLGERRLFTACLRELSERHEAEAALERQRQGLSQSERLSVLGAVAAEISHEIKNPLSVILAQASMLQHDLSGSTHADSVASVLRASERCTKILNTFLDQSRQTQRAMESIEVQSLVASTLELAAPIIRDQQVDLAVRHHTEGLAVQGHSDQLGQVVLNLVFNALHAMQGGQFRQYLEIETRLSGSGEQVEVSVSDSGPGIPPRIRERIFEPFFTTKPTGQGTGLGLKICSDIAAAHGGRIKVGDAARGGARFTVVLPVTQPVLRAAVAAEMHDPASPLILVVDDEPEVAKVLVDILAHRGFNAQAVWSGAEALKRLKSGSFDAVLCDMRMPGMDGMELYAAIGREYPQLSNHVGFVTADAAAADIDRFLRDTAAPFTEKPFAPSAVEALVRQVLQSGSRGSS